MHFAKFATAAMTVVCLAATLHSAQAQTPAIHRTDLVSHELSVAGKEGIQVRVDFEPGAFAPRHAHPGEEIAYVLQGTLEYQLGEQPPVRLKAGESLFIPAGTPHSARNVGSGQASELATYIVTKGAKLVVPAQ
ncbi:cupin domain-containing protein [Cupriavidus sp. MP-37]|uniref:cupin domain-containing protein n=1 Tax=Cupriavidus sp. MP-37 TaxID=2884455 RepID=UPI001D09F3FE|nr:cupin domain-containing protein [Cupriavidus sp. MP-37]UDM52388.1 cupin domain-containing protein [Cupriavidus sp. MP-37]